MALISLKVYYEETLEIMQIFNFFFSERFHFQLFLFNKFEFCPSPVEQIILLDCVAEIT